MTILHVLDHSWPHLSGYSIRSRNIVAFQQAAALRPVVVTSPKHGRVSASVEIVDGIPHHRTRPAGPFPKRLPVIREMALMLRLASRILQIARREAAELLHAHSPVLNAVPALWAARRLQIPLVYEVRAFWEDAAVDHGTTRRGSPRYRITRALETAVLHRTDAVVTIAEALRRELIHRGVPSQRITVVPNGVDTARFQPMERPSALARELGLHGGPVLAFIGSFYRYEGVDFLVQCLPRLRERVPGAQLLLVGSGEQEPIVRRAASLMGQSLIFAGPVPYARVSQFYALTDIFVCPRRRNRLTDLVTPLKPLEAMAMALPVLASDAGGLSELICHGQTGILFPAESQDALVEQAVALIREPELRKLLGSRARQWVLEERTWPRVVSRYMSLYAYLKRPH